MSQHVAAGAALSKPEAPAPDPLARFFEPLERLPGVGPKVLALLARLLADGQPPRRLDLLFHLPYATLRRELRDDLVGAPEGERVTLEIEIERHLPPPPPRVRKGARPPYRIRCRCAGEALFLVFFNARAALLEEMLPVGGRRVVSGQLGRYGERFQIVHPELVTTRERLGRRGALEPVYPKGQGVSANLLVRVGRAAVDDLPDLPEWQDEAWLRERRWPGFSEALRALHAPDQAGTVEPDSPPRARLAYDELFANQLALQLVRGDAGPAAGRAIAGTGDLRGQVLSTLPFALTAGQHRTLQEIDADLAAPFRMLRLLQGDVGSGKTLIALLAMLRAIETGHQAALMAPTELLAAQHATTIARLLAPIGIVPAVVTGRERGLKRRRVVNALAEGRVPLAIGTHALFQADVAFRDLALVVIDEQHRFGVQQRMDLLAKASRGDLLVMTATPIPRTMVLALYGDMAVSELREKPPGRQPIETRVLPLGREDEVVAAVGRALGQGERIYWVCPQVEADEDRDEEVRIGTAVQRHETLRTTFGERVGLIHGRLAEAEKRRAMAAFVRGETRLLVATTVIEVGVDVPEASVMVIENAERFGLAQLHQLRGRVGRGDRAGSCLLLYRGPLSATARARLAALKRSDDGFRLAEEDLRLRGPGEVLGTRQSGLPALRVTDLARHADLLASAHDDARLVLARDPGLHTPRGRALRLLLRLFERDAAMAFLGSG